MEGQAHAQHAGLVLPSGEQTTPAAALQRHASHDGKAVGVLLHRLDGVVVAVLVERRRHQDRPVDAGDIHGGDEFLVAQRRALEPGFAERPVRAMGRPDVDLRIDD